MSSYLPNTRLPAAMVAHAPAIKEPTNTGVLRRFLRGQCTNGIYPPAIIPGTLARYANKAGCYKSAVGRTPVIRSTGHGQRAHLSQHP
jgi:hypothetical protein